MKTHFIEKRLDYDGSQLKSLFAYLNFGIRGNSIVAFRGACNVTFEHMVDGEDLLDKAKICGSDMLHFIIELFPAHLFSAVAIQRLFASTVKDELIALSKDNISMHRDGDDLYWQEKKFSISIATVSPTSSLIHFALNISNEGTPVATCALSDFKVEPKVLAEAVLKRFKAEMESTLAATEKVRWVQ